MQQDIWEKEYRKPQLVTNSDTPQTSVKDFIRWLRREAKVPLENLHVLDLGCGNGKNSNYIADLDTTNRVVGIDISQTALTNARATAHERNLDASVTYIHQSIGEKLPFEDGTFDLLLDVTASNSLSETERAVYLAEAYRVLKSGGHFFVRALAKDGDTNAQSLLKLHPGPEKDTYIMPNLNLTERVFSKQDFIDTYASFELISLEKETHYSKFAGRSFKRNFWIAYLKKA